MAAATFRYLVQLHKDVPKAARFYSEGLGFTIDVCTLRWAELHSGPLKLSLLHSPSDHVQQKGYTSLLSFTVPDINSTVTKLMALGAEMDGPIKHEIHGKGAMWRINIKFRDNYLRRPEVWPKYKKPHEVSEITNASLSVKGNMIAAMRCADGHVLGLYEPS